jgi:hypothetical protein
MSDKEVDLIPKGLGFVFSWNNEHRCTLLEYLELAFDIRIRTSSDKDLQP